MEHLVLPIVLAVLFFITCITLAKKIRDRKDKEVIGYTIIGSALLAGFLLFFTALLE